MKSKVMKSIILGVVAVGIGFGGYYTYKTFFVKKTVSAAAQFYPVNVKKMNLGVSVQGTGSAYAAVTKDVTPNNIGELKKLTVEVGDTVKKGQTLFVSDSDELRNNVTTAKNNVTKQKLTLTSDQNAEQVDDNKVAADKLAVAEAKLQLNNAYKQFNKMTVTAPINGVITAVNSSSGDTVQADKSILTIVDMSSIKIKVSVDELDIAKIKLGQKADIKFDAIKDKTYEGSVETIAQAGTTSNNVTTYEVVVAVKDPSGIKLGMNANVTISIESKENAIVIPAEALVELNNKKYVKVESNGKLAAIETGLETQDYIEVTKGLTEGDRVLVQLPKSSITNDKNNFRGGLGGEMMGGLGPKGGNMGGPVQAGNNKSQN